jgi:hypothetical protein
MAPENVPTSERLRRDIDSGRAGDKVDYPDPAAAPLGADDEAAGFPPSAAERRLAARAQTNDERPDMRGRFVKLALLAIVVIAAVALVATLALRASRS